MSVVSKEYTFKSTDCHSFLLFTVSLLPTRVLGLLNQQKLIRSQTGNSSKALLGPLLQQEGVRTSNRFSCCLLLGRCVCPGVRLEGGLGNLLTTQVVSCSGDMCTLPLLLSTLCFCSRLFRSNSWVFWSLCIFCPKFDLTAHACSYFQSCIVSLYFVLEERCVQVGALQHCSKGSQVPDYLIPSTCTSVLYIISIL